MAKGECISETQEQKSVLTRSNDYRTKCKSGHTSGSWEAHHILCNHALASREEDIEADYRDYVEDCLWITDWNLNNPDNLTGLPRNRQYRNTNGRDPENLPSHQVDHNTSDGYTKECKDWMTENVWDTLKHKKKDHEVSAKAIADLLNKGTKHFKDELMDRGKRKQGTLYCWERRHPDHSEHVEKWYYPFSMGEEPRKRNPGAKGSMTHIFAQIK